MFYPAALTIAAITCPASIQPATPSPLSQAVQGLGLSGEALTASGVQPSQIAAIVAALRESPYVNQLVQLQSQIRTAEAAQAATPAEDGELPNGAQAFGDAGATMEQLRLQRASIVAAARQLVQAQLSTAQATALGSWWTAAPFLPSEMRVRPWNADELKTLREALQSEKRCVERGEAIPTETSSLLATLRAEPVIVASAASLTAYRTDNAAALASALASSN